jgi:MFS family permease
MNKWMTLAVVTIGAFMGNLDASIVNISLPAIAHAFGTSFNGSLEWVVIGYLIVIASVLLTIGRLADTLGRKPIWVTGLVVFTRETAHSLSSFTFTVGAGSSAISTAMTDYAAR